MTQATDKLNPYEKALRHLDRTKARIDKGWEAYREVFEYAEATIPEDNLINAGFDMWGDPVLSISVDTMKEASEVVADIVRKCNLRVFSRANDDKPTISLTAEREGSNKAIYITATARKCKRVKVGEETVTRDVFEIRCEES